MMNINIIKIILKIINTILTKKNMKKKKNRMIWIFPKTCLNTQGFLKSEKQIQIKINI